MQHQVTEVEGGVVEVEVVGVEVVGVVVDQGVENARIVFLYVR